MQAITQDAYGSTDALRLREIERPETAPNEVRIRVVAAGVYKTQAKHAQEVRLRARRNKVSAVRDAASLFTAADR
jgi:NADPH:quinone reductase-like Zn-dependent oxidoreductase